MRIRILLLLNRYASALDSLPTSMWREQPLLYMNGWDLFEAHPELWKESVAELPGTICNLSAAAYQTMHKRVSTAPPCAAHRRSNLSCPQSCQYFVLHSPAALWPRAICSHGR
jgi:hypothetical protein